MLLLFAHKSRAYLSIAKPGRRSREIAILYTVRIAVSNRKRLVEDLEWLLQFEDIRLDAPFKAQGNTRVMITSQHPDWLRKDLPHAGFALYQIGGCFCFSPIERIPTGGWRNSSDPIIRDLKPPSDPDGTFEPIAQNTVTLLCRLLKRQSQDHPPIKELN